MQNISGPEFCKLILCKELIGLLRLINVKQSLWKAIIAFATFTAQKNYKIWIAYLLKSYLKIDQLSFLALNRLYPFKAIDFVVNAFDHLNHWS